MLQARRVSLANWSRLRRALARNHYPPSQATILELGQHQPGFLMPGAQC